MSDTPPSCFGKHWNPKEPECRGGNDPSYINQVTGSNRRETCRWYSQCATAQNSPVVSPVIPPQALLSHRPPPAPPRPVPSPAFSQTPAPPAPPSPQMQHQPVLQYSSYQGVQAPQYVNHQHQHLQQQPHHVQGPYVQPVYAAQPVAVPANQPMVGAATQSFLMVPEPYNDGASHGQRLMRTMFRSMAKAGALAVANYMDYYPITPYE
jgi:hypothetical protein